MAHALQFYSRLIALAALFAAAGAAFLALSPPDASVWVVSSPQALSAAALWYIYAALRLGHSRSSERLFARSTSLAGFLFIIAFGAVTILSLVIGPMLLLNAYAPSMAATLANPVGLFAAGAAAVFAVLALGGARSVAYRRGLVRVDGEVVIPAGYRVNMRQLRRDYVD
ncbi:MAG: hypothetical protein AAFR35_07035 [Pseudomonadota bacterium]